MVPSIISIFLSIVSIAAIFVIKTSTSLQLSDGEMVNSIIAISACLGGLISATFVVYGYIQTNKAFLFSLKPSLLIRVVSEHLPNSQQTKQVPYTFIHYANTSNNEFVNLTMEIKLKIGTREIDLSDLFKPKMSMAAQDTRQNRIETFDILGQRGIDINREVQAGNAAILKTGYRFTFNGKEEKRAGAEYKWNAGISHWEIL